MIVGISKETKERENRVALTPDAVKDLLKKGFTVQVEKGAGLNSFYSDDAYQNAGATISSRESINKNSDVLLRVNAPSADEIVQMKKGAVLISFLWAGTHPETVDACVKAGISAFSMDAIPRISRAQKMDALSSQANLGGYKAVILSADTIGKILPMMTTAAGTIRPCKVLIFGAGVAGLQAVATAKRLGAVVEVTDVRPETREQVQSLGAKFITVEGDASVKTEGGYVKAVSEDFLKKQQELVAKHVKEADIVITTALIPGKKAPLLMTEDMVKSMRFGSVILDMAVEQGGNVAGSELNKTIQKNGVTIIGEGNLPSLLPMNASDLYAKNIQTFLYHLADNNGFKFELQDEITKGSLIVHNGQKMI
jgi:NAD(P) transhydrogenase subunit alpha